MVCPSRGGRPPSAHASSILSTCSHAGRRRARTSLACRIPPITRTARRPRGHAARARVAPACRPASLALRMPPGCGCRPGTHAPGAPRADPGHPTPPRGHPRPWLPPPAHPGPIRSCSQTDAGRAPQAVRAEPTISNTAGSHVGARSHGRSRPFAKKMLCRGGQDLGNVGEALPRPLLGRVQPRAARPEVPPGPASRVIPAPTAPLNGRRGARRAGRRPGHPSASSGGSRSSRRRRWRR